ncbi:TetR/AcrR family transcriptional regulator [uncultured Secundilactobacillus sp.]|uniref:TetR/AcrR family transcriptional regulator n=2 Tax=uncultured Secundilactobacillus sp. TaxID=2813935 RepID=UPI002583834F|nr:TetR/AcrR family transcriptional regulator [uncultured Secundilactobacillus sp.]
MQIITAFLELLSRDYFDKISVSQVAKKSFVTRSTFYRYFDDKNDLLLQAALETLDGSESDEPLLVQFATYVESHAGFLKHLSPSRQSRMNLTDVVSGVIGKMVTDKVQYDGDQSNDPFVNLIKSADNSPLMVDALVGLLMGMLDHYHHNGFEVDEDELNRTMLLLSSHMTVN